MSLFLSAFMCNREGICCSHSISVAKATEGGRIKKARNCAVVWQKEGGEGKKSPSPHLLFSQMRRRSMAGFMSFPLSRFPGPFCVGEKMRKNGGDG